jgi:hypothetical protein
VQTGQSGFHLEEIVDFDNGVRDWHKNFRIIEFAGMKVRLAPPKTGNIAWSDTFRTLWWPLARVRKANGKLI